MWSELASRPLGNNIAHDAAGTITIPARIFAQHLALGVGLIRRYGDSEPTLIQALLRPLTTVLTATDDPQGWRTIEEQAELLVIDAEREVPRRPI